MKGYLTGTEKINKGKVSGAALTATALAAFNSQPVLSQEIPDDFNKKNVMRVDDVKSFKSIGNKAQQAINYAKERYEKAREQNEANRQWREFYEKQLATGKMIGMEVIADCFDFNPEKPTVPGSFKVYLEQMPNSLRKLVENEQILLKVEWYKDGKNINQIRRPISENMIILDRGQSYDEIVYSLASVNGNKYEFYGSNFIARQDNSEKSKKQVDVKIEKLTDQILFEKLRNLLQEEEKKGFIDYYNLDTFSGEDDFKIAEIYINFRDGREDNFRLFHYDINSDDDDGKINYLQLTLQRNHSLKEPEVFGLGSDYDYEGVNKIVEDLRRYIENQKTEHQKRVAELNKFGDEVVDFIEQSEFFPGGITKREVSRFSGEQMIKLVNGATIIFGQSNNNSIFLRIRNDVQKLTYYAGNILAGPDLDPLSEIKRIVKEELTKMQENPNPTSDERVDMAIENIKRLTK